MLKEFNVTVGSNGKCNNLSEESQSDGKNISSSFPNTWKSQIKWISENEAKQNNKYPAQQKMWTTMNNYNFYQKLDCEQAQGRNSFKICFEQICKNTSMFLEEFMV